MTDVTRHLGELMGRGDAETASSQTAAQAATTAPDAAQGVSSAVAGGPDAATQALQGSDAAAQAGVIPPHALDHYAFPFGSHEVFGLLPHSIGAQAQTLWQVAHQLAGSTSAMSLTVAGILVGAVAVAAVSTARVWRRGEEFAVAGFGDRFTKVGSRYMVRQEAPISAFADKHGVLRRPQPEAAPVLEPAAVADSETKTTEKPAHIASNDTWRARREAQAAKAKKQTQQQSNKRAAQVEPIVVPPESAKSEAQPETKPSPEAKAKPEANAKPDAKAKSEAPKEKKGKEAETPLAADETKRPKTVKRQLFRRSATTVNYVGSFHGSYGSFQQTDRLFARDYLRQTNEAFEAAYLKGKGPNLADLRVGDNHRGERLFMMATRASFEDPPSALAALWQAVDEDRSDAVAWLRLAHFYLELGEFDHAQRILSPLLANSERLGIDIIVAASANSLGKIAAQRGEHDGARKLFTKSIAHAEHSDNPFMLGVACANAGLLEASRKKFDPARSLLERGIKGFESSEERVSAARTKVSLGVVHSVTGDDETARKVWSEAAETLVNSGFEEEAAQIKRWLAGESTPNAIIL